MFGSCSELIKTTKSSSYGTRYSQHSIRTAATKRRQLTTGESPLVSAVHANCLQTTNLLFVEVIHLGLHNQKRLKHAINDPSSSRHMYPLGTYFLRMVILLLAWICCYYCEVPAALQECETKLSFFSVWLAHCISKTIGHLHDDVIWLQLPECISLQSLLCRFVSRTSDSSQKKKYWIQ